MKRKYEILITSKNGKIAIGIDSMNKATILAYIRQDERHTKKFKYISNIILENLHNSTLYDKEEINHKCKGVTAMKFFIGQENDRIYCKEIKSSNGVHIVITSILHEKKKTTKLSSKEINIIETIGGYLYEN